MENESKERIDAFMNGFGELVKKYNVDIVSFPQFVPDEHGGWRLIVSAQPMDLSQLPQKSPFIAK